MTRSSRPKLLALIVALVVAIPPAAVAVNAIDWAFNNGITTAKSPTIFGPDDQSTRRDSVTFVKRYNDNIVA